MIWLAQIWRRYPQELISTFRSRFGISWFEVGVSVPFGEAVHLARAAYADTSTDLGAVVAGWAYPASIPDLATVVLLGLVNQKSAIALLPFRPGDTAQKPSGEEIQEATELLDQMIIFG